MEIEEERLKVEKRCTELATQLEKASEKGEKKILENEVEKLLLRREEELKSGWKGGFEEKINVRIESEVGEIPVPVGNPSLDQSLASELGCPWNGGVQLDQSLNSSQDVASQTDLFASELKELKQAMADDSPERKHFFAIEEDDCSLDIHLEEEGEELVVGDGDKLGSALEGELVGETEASLEEELRSSYVQEGGDELESTQGSSKSGGKASLPFCGKNNILGMEMLVYDSYEVESNSSFEKEASMSKPSLVDFAVNTDTVKEVPKKTVAGFVKSLLAWLLLLLTLFTTFGAVRVDHKVHLPSTWLLLYHLFGSSLPFPIIAVAFDSNPRPHIN